MTESNSNMLMQSLVSDLSVAFDSLNSKNDAGAELPPSPLNIYKAASLLFQINANGNGYQKGNLSNAILQLNNLFESLLSSMDDDYLANVILNDINSAFDKLVEKATASLEELTHRKNPSAKEELERNLSACFSAMKPLQIIYGHGRGNSLKGGEVSKQQSRCCRLGYRPKLCSQIVFLYDAASQLSVDDPYQQSQEILEVQLSPLQLCLLNTLSSLLVHGVVLGRSFTPQSSDEDDAIQAIMQVIQSISSDQTSTCLGDVLQWQKDHSHIIELGVEEQINVLEGQNSTRQSTLEKIIDSKFSQQVYAQKEYLLLMLSSAKKTTLAKSSYIKDSKERFNSDATKSNRNDKGKKSKLSGLDRLVIQIRDLFPSYGDGYIEAALACYNHDLERTTMALLEMQSDPNSNSVHPRLRVLDRNLPSRKKEKKQRYDEEDRVEDIEAKNIQKSLLREMEVQQENEAFLLAGAVGEYNDDYDDQYDGVGGEDGIGGADGGLYDMDYEQIKIYNKAAKAMEEDRIFWESNRNSNRRGGNREGDDRNGNRKKDGDVQADDDSDDEDNATKKYRGADKGKGGRSIGPDGRYLPFPKSRKKGGNNQKQATTAKDSSNVKEANTSASGTRKGTKAPGKNGKKNSGDKTKKQNAGEEMTKIQKRRKNDNKAKIGNHHRKERAMKKAAF